MGRRAVTEDMLLGGRVRLLQPAKGYRVAIDPVLLAAAVPARRGERVLDLGTGSGAAALCLAARIGGCLISGLEQSAALARLARRSVRLNGYGGSIEIIEGDLSQPPAVLIAGNFDHVMANPPYLEAAAAERRGSKDRAAAHVEGVAGLDLWVGFALRMARQGGSLTFIHRADRLGDLLSNLRGRAGGIVVLPLWPKRGRAAKRVIVHARKGSRVPLVLAPGLTLHGTTGAYTRAAEAILRGRAELPVNGSTRVGKRRRRD